MEQARRAVGHALGCQGQRLSPLLPNGIYTIPEVSMVGETEESLKKKGIDYVVGRARYEDNARGQIIGDKDGFLKLLFQRDDMKLVGVHVIGELATEIVHIGLMAMLTESTAEIFVEACFNVPTLGLLYKTATLEAIREAAKRATVAVSADRLTADGQAGLVRVRFRHADCFARESTPLAAIHGIGPKHAELLAKLGLVTHDDLLHFVPRRYEDRRHLKPLSEAQEGEIDHGAGKDPLREGVALAGGRSVFEIMVGPASVTQKSELVRGMWFNQSRPRQDASRRAASFSCTASWARAKRARG